LGPFQQKKNSFGMGEAYQHSSYIREVLTLGMWLPGYGVSPFLVFLVGNRDQIGTQIDPAGYKSTLFYRLAVANRLLGHISAQSVID
jgi:hypothetical protein